MIDYSDLNSLNIIAFLALRPENIQYDISENRIIIDYFGLTYISHHDKNTRVKEILDDFHSSLKNIKVLRENVQILDPSDQVPETEILKELKFLHKEVQEDEARFNYEIQKREREKVKRALEKIKEEIRKVPIKNPIKYKFRLTGVPLDQAIKWIEVGKEHTIKDVRNRAWISYKINPILMIQFIFQGKVLTDDRVIGEVGVDPEKDVITIMATGAGGPVTLDKPKTYEIDLGFQYYSVMMEQQSYMLYVYFSRDELIIEDEERKTVYKTKIQVTTTKKGHPRFNLRLKGDGFETHPVFGQVKVKKKTISPALMVFSITPKKSKKLEGKKSEKRFLHISIEFEENIVSYTILAILVQPKHFSLDVGPLHFNLSKNQAMLVAFIPVLITILSSINAIFSFDFTGSSSSSSADALNAFIPGAGSLVALGTFLILLLKKGVFPIKQKVSGFLAFDKSSLMK